MKTHVKTFRNELYTIDDKTFFACKAGLYILNKEQSSKILIEIASFDPDKAIEHIKERLDYFIKVEL